MEQNYKIFLVCLFVHIHLDILTKVTSFKDSVMEFSFDLCLMFRWNQFHQVNFVKDWCVPSLSA